MTRTEYDFLKSTLETIQEVFRNYCNLETASGTDYRNGFNLGQYGGLETAMNIVDSCFNKDDEYYEWLKEQNRRDCSSKEKYYYIIAFRNKKGDEQIVGCTDKEDRAKQFCSTFDSSKIPDGYKIGYTITKQIIKGVG